MMVSSIYAAITFTCIMVADIILPHLLPGFFKETGWTTGKQIIYITGIVVLVGVVNYSISPLMVETGYSLQDAIRFQGITIAVGLLPITIYTFFKKNLLLKKFEQQAAILEIKLQEKIEAEQQPSLPVDTTVPNKLCIEFTGDYQHEKLLLPADEIYMISSANNYVKIYYLKKGKIAYSIIRMTMKKVEETLEAWPAFFRCHRAHIVNLDKIQHVEGNAQGYRLRFPDVEETIPVSRNLNSEFSDKLLALRNNSL
jgi:hypothetical protein